MSKKNLPGKPHRIPAIDDIPEAVRETPDTQPQSLLNRKLLIGGSAAAGVVILLAAISIFFRPAPAADNGSTVGQQTGQNASNPAQPGKTGTLLGHFPYQEAKAEDLKPIVPDGSIKLRKAAAKSYLEMAAAAAAEGVNLVVISGFRSRADQQYLFFEVKAERGQETRQRAEVSAPPGYSEHHTGYAVDLGDANTPATNLNPDFDKTAAFRWLQANAAHYSFELSFPKNNAQGIHYEPWHWRYVGDSHSLETFYKARSPR